MKKTLIIFTVSAAGVVAVVLAMTAWLNEQDKQARLKAVGRR